MSNNTLTISARQIHFLVIETHEIRLQKGYCRPHGNWSEEVGIYKRKQESKKKKEKKTRVRPRKQ